MASESDPIVQRADKLGEQGFEKSFLECCFKYWREPWFESALEENKQRDAFWDNWKGMCILMVCMLHLLDSTLFSDMQGGEYSLSPNGIARGLLCLADFIAMPSFAFITGYFSTATMGPKQLTLIIQYTLCWFIQHSMVWFVVVVSQGRFRTPWSQGLHHDPDALPIPFFEIFSLDWYLWCVIIWRLVLPALALVERMQFLSFVFAGFFVYTDAFNSGYSCCPFGFLPFFVAGFRFKDLVRNDGEKFIALRSDAWRRAFFAVSVFVVMLTNIYAGESGNISRGMDCLYGDRGPLRGIWFCVRGDYAGESGNISRGMDCLYGDRGPLNDFGVSPPDFCHSAAGAMYTTAYFCASFAFVHLFMSVVPNNQILVMTKAGKNSIYIYFGHLMIAVVPLAILREKVLHSAMNQWILLALMLLIIVFIWACLAQQWFRCICQPCIEPDVETCCLARPQKGTSLSLTGPPS